MKKLTELEVKHLYSHKQAANWPVFGPGDTIVVSERIFEEKRSRIQKFQGVVLKRTGSGNAENVLVRKESANGVYVEKMFPLNSPLVEDIVVERRGKVRRAYISYQRLRSGKAARIKEKRKVK